MTEHHDPRLLSGPSLRKSWPQLVLLAVLGVGLAIAAFFFFVVAVTAGAILLTVIGVRVWWLTRKIRAHAKNSAPLEGDYTVVERDRTIERIER